MQFTAQPSQTQTNQSRAQKDSKKSSKANSSEGKKLWRLVVSVVILLVVAVQLVTLYFVFDLRGQGSRLTNAQIVQEISQLTDVPLTESPTIALINNAEELRAENSIHQQVYKDARNGDYVVGFKDKMIIFRRGSNEIVYEGKSPGRILQDTQSQLIARIVELAKSEDLLPEDSEEQPQINVVTDVEQTKAQNPDFYKDLAEQDVIAVFNRSGLIVVYRTATDELIITGNFSVSIN